MTVSYQAVLRLMDGQLEVLEASARTMPWGTPGGAAVAEPGAAEHAGPAENTDGTVTLDTPSVDGVATGGDDVDIEIVSWLSRPPLER